MKIRSGCIIFLICLLSSCNDVFQQQGKTPLNEPRNEKVTVTINIISDNTRSVLPSFDIAHYKLFGSITGEEILIKSFANTAGAYVDLIPGVWNLTLDAYNNSDQLIMQGKVTGKAINPAGSNLVTFTLLPINSGTGTVSITVKFPPTAGITRVTAECEGDAPEELVIDNFSAAYTTVKNAGNYFISIKLYTGISLRAAVSEKASVRGNVTSQKTIITGLNDLKPLITDERFVAATAAGSGDGRTWDSASDDLQKMIDEANFATLTGADRAIVHVAAGTYKPRYKPNADGTSDYETIYGDRDSVFILRRGVELRGGYAASGETIDETERKSRFSGYGVPLNENYRCALSGDFNSNDLGNAIDGFTGMDENAFHILLCVDIPANSNTVIDGFTISGGNAANGSGELLINTGSGSRTIDRYNGGGIHNNNASPSIINVTVCGNYANNGGAGIHNTSSLPLLKNVTLSGNRLGMGNGGGMENNASSPVLTDVVISANRASSGGGMYNVSSSPILNRTLVSDNIAIASGGGIRNISSAIMLFNSAICGNSAFNGGGIFIDGASVKPAILNVTVSGNLASNNGGGIYNDSASPVLVNVTLTGNKANSGGGIYNIIAGASPVIRNSIIWGNSSGVIVHSGAPELSSCIVQDGWSGSGSENINTDPRFISPLLYANAPVSGGAYSLQQSSPAINFGEESYYPNTWAKWSAAALFGTTMITQTVYNQYALPALLNDAAGTDRIKGFYIDLGAFDEQGGKTPDFNRYVRQDGMNEGTSWLNASNDIQKMLDAAWKGNQRGADKAVVHVAAGIYKPLYKPNANGTINYATTYGDRDSTFFLRPGVELRGGYIAAGETIDEQERKNRFTEYGVPLSETYRAIFSGDFMGNDGGNAMDGFTGTGENAHHIILAVDIPNNGKTVIDGITVSGGCADGSGSISISAGGSSQSVAKTTGAGIRLYYSSPMFINVNVSGNSAASSGGGILYGTNSSPLLLNTSVNNNYSGASGGGIYCNDTSSIISNSIIAENKAVNNGGGLYNASATLVINESIISGNTASNEGGGIYNFNQATLKITNTLISGNYANSGGGGIFSYICSSSLVSLVDTTISKNTVNTSGGGIYSHTTRMILTNVSISGNDAVTGSGGGIYLNFQCTTICINSTVTGNSANSNGGGIYGDTAQGYLTRIFNSTIAGNRAGSGGGITHLNYSSQSLRVQNSIIYGNSSQMSSYAPVYDSTLINNSILQSSYTGSGTGNSTEDPLFTNQRPYYEAPTPDGDYSLESESPAINAGDNDWYPDTYEKWITNVSATLITRTEYDQYVLPALQIDAGGSSRIKGGAIDMGAYEY